MNRKSFWALCILCGVSLAAALPSWVQFAPASQPDQAVEFQTVKGVADQRALSLWSRAQNGDVVPFVDIDGRTIAFMFHYRIGGGGFPEYAVAAGEIQAELPGLANPENHSGYAYVLASARYDRAPILCYGEGGTELFVTLDRARERARDFLAGEPVLTRVYYEWPLSFFEFSDGVSSVVCDAHTLGNWSSTAAFKARIAAGQAGAIARLEADAAALKAAAGAQMRAEWDRWLTDAPLDTTNVFVPGYQYAPFYDWSYGCSPTSGTIVVGYLDNALNYGRCIYDFFQRWSVTEGQVDYQVPWAQREMALAFQTETISGGTYPDNIGPGLQAFGGDKGYSFEVGNMSGGGWVDWCWQWDSVELLSGHSMVWSVSWETHSLAAFGMRLEPKDMFVHNTWWAPAAWWHYTDGAYYSMVNSSSVNPSGAGSYNVRMTYPRGDTQYNHNGAGEVLFVGRTSQVRWTSSGGTADSLSLDYSTDAGWTWQALAHGLPDNGAYDWDIPVEVPASCSARVRVKAFQGGEYAAGDASYGNFFLATVPLSPRPLSPANGQQMMNPPIVLVVDSMAYVDSFRFIFYIVNETLLEQRSLARVCSVPSNLVQRGRCYNWRVQARNSFGWGAWSAPWSIWVRFAGVEEAPGARSETGLSLSGITNHHVAVSFGIPIAGLTRLVVYDAVGRPVRTLVNERLAAGEHILVWDRRDMREGVVPSGCYFVRLDAAGRSQVRKLQLVSSQ